VRFRGGLPEEVQGPGSSKFGDKAFSMLTEDERREFCVELLDEIGAQNIRHSGDELIHSCPLPFGGHAGGDRNPSAALNWRKGVFNCFSCGNGGGLIWYIASVRGESSEQAAKWVLDRSGQGADEATAQSIIEWIESSYFTDDEGNEAPMPHYSERTLDPWRLVHPWLTEVRGIERSNIVECEVGYDESDERIVIPHFWQGQLVGWQKRRLRRNAKQPKYQSTPDFPRDRTLYRLPSHHAELVVLVESPMTAVAKCHVAPIAATFGSEVTDRQARHLSKFPKVTLWMDNDQAGWHSVAQIAPALSSTSFVRVVSSPWMEDMDELPDEVVGEMIEEAVPWQVWQQPAVNSLRSFLART